MKQLRGKKRSQQWVAIILAVVMVLGHMAMASAYEETDDSGTPPIINPYLSPNPSTEGIIGNGSGTDGLGVIGGSSDGTTDIVQNLLDLNGQVLLGDGLDTAEEGDGDDDGGVTEPDAGEFNIVFSVYPLGELKNGDKVDVKLAISSKGGTASAIPEGTKIEVVFPAFVPSSSLLASALELYSTRGVIQGNYTVTGAEDGPKTLTMYTTKPEGENLWLLTLDLQMVINMFYYNGDNSVSITVGNSHSTGEIKVDEGTGEWGEDEVKAGKRLLNQGDAFGDDFIDNKDGIARYQVDIELPILSKERVGVDDQPIMATIEDWFDNAKFSLSDSTGTKFPHVSEANAAEIEAFIMAPVLAALRKAGMSEEDIASYVRFEFKYDTNNVARGFKITIFGDTTAITTIKMFYCVAPIVPITSNEYITNRVYVQYGKADAEKVVKVLANRTSAALWKKTVDGGKDYILLKEDELLRTGTKEVDFEFTVSALGSVLVTKGQTIVNDTLDAPFSFKSSPQLSGGVADWQALQTNGDAYEPTYAGQIGVYADVDGKNVKIASNILGALTSSKYDLSFTANVDLSQIEPGASGRNKVENNIVYVYREAELTINKTWQTATGEDKKGDVIFELFNKDNVKVGEVTLVEGQTSATMRFWYYSAGILDGVNAYTLKETVQDDSTYSSAPNITIFIDKYATGPADNEVRGVRFVADLEGNPLDGAVSPGLHTVEFDNEYDDSYGKIVFFKYGKRTGVGNYLLDGAQFSLVVGEGTSASTIPVSLKYVGEETRAKANGQSGTVTGAVYAYDSTGASGNTFTTKNGYAFIDGLPYTIVKGETIYNTYTIEETQAPINYLKDNTKLTFVLNKNNKTDSKASNYLTNTLYESGEISVKKVDENNAALAGVEFTLSRYINGALDTSFTPVKKTTATTTGIATFDKLANGVYRLEETGVPLGYKAFTGYIEVTIDNLTPTTIDYSGLQVDVDGKLTPVNVSLTGTTIRMTWKNEQKFGEIKFTKVIKDTTTQLAGATFALYTLDVNNNKTPYADPADSSKTYTITTDATGIVLFTGLPYGRYAVVETSAPAHYFADPGEVWFNVNDATTVIITANSGQLDAFNNWPNPKLGRIAFTKVAQGTSTRLMGATFKLFTAAGAAYPSATNQYTVTTDAANGGVVAFEDLPYGDYLVRETTAPQYYFADPYEVLFSVGATTVDVNGKLDAYNSWPNPKLGKIEFTKVSRDNVNTKLGGAKFQLYSVVSGVRTAVKQYGTNNDYIVTSDSNGYVLFEHLPYGNYVVVETDAPNGYVLGTLPEQNFTVGSTTNPSASHNWVNDTKKGQINVYKYDASDPANPDSKAKPLAGVTFQLLNSLGGVIGTATTNAAGLVTFTDLAAGTYYILEYSVPTGYTISPEYATVTEAMKHPIVLGPNTTDVWLQSVDVFNERILQSLKVIKNDELGVGFKKGEATFQLLATTMLNGVAYDKEVSTDDNGEALFTNVPYGTYTLTETKASEGYAPMAARTIVINQAYTGLVRTETYTNYPYEVEVIKLDGTTRLKGAIFQLKEGANFVTGQIQTNGTYKYTGTTADGTDPSTLFETGVDGNFKITHIKAATYTLYEYQAPEGYQKIEGAISGNIVVTGNETQRVIQPKQVQNGKIRGGLKIRKTDDKGKLLDGIAFEITGPNGYQETHTTGEGGVEGCIVLTDLEFGTYYIRELEPLPGYMLADVAEGIVALQGQTELVEIVNSPITGEISIKKTGDQGALLPGVMFRLRPLILTEEDGTITNAAIGSAASAYRYAPSEADGIAKFEDVPYGAYVIDEYTVPAEYVKDTAPRYVNVGLPDEAIADIEALLGVTFETNGVLVGNITGAVSSPIEWLNSTVRGELSLRKVDGNDIGLPGARFELYKLENGAQIPVQLLNHTSGVVGKYAFVSADATKTATRFDTDGASEAFINLLPYGTYRLYEKEVPDGYKLDQPYYDFTVHAGNAQIALTVKNPPRTGTLRVYKKDLDSEAGNVYLSGAQIRVYQQKADGTADTEKGRLFEVTTSIGGVGTISGIPLGKYVAIEEVPPVGYQLNAVNDQPFEITEQNIDEEVSVELTYANPRAQYGLRVLKVEDINGVKTPVAVAGAEFLVCHVDTGLYRYLITNASGVAVATGIPSGQYTIEETKAPLGYMRDTTVHTVMVDKIGDVVEIQVVNEKILGGVHIRKLDQNGAVLNGAKFQLYVDGQTLPVKLTQVSANNYAADANGTITEITVGEATITGLGEGTYRFVETVVPDGYIQPDSERVFTVTDANFQSVISVDIINIKDEAAIALRKVDADDNSILLQGARFQLSRLNNGVYGYVETKVSDSTGYVVFTGLTVGSYRIDEVLPPTGYRLWSNPIYFVVDSEAKIQVNGSTLYQQQNGVFIATVINQKANQYFQVRKVSSATGATLSGARFSLTGTGSNASYYTTLTSGTNGLTGTVSLAGGTYYLRELAAPTGYQRISSTFTVVVDENGIAVDGVRLTGSNTFVFEAENTPEVRSALLYKTDSGTKNPLSGAVFTVTQRGTGTTRTLTTNSNGVTGSITLTPGYSYDIVETTAPSGYTRPLQGWTVTISASGAISVSGRGITAYTDSGSVIINIDNTATTTTTTTTGGSSGSTTSSGSSTTSTDEEAIPLGPGLPRTGQYTNVGLLILGAIIMLISCAALMLYVVKGKRKEDTYDILMV